MVTPENGPTAPGCSTCGRAITPPRRDALPPPTPSPAAHTTRQPQSICLRAEQPCFVIHTQVGNLFSSHCFLKGVLKFLKKSVFSINFGGEMGTWGIGIFDNDDSVDFINEFDNVNNLYLINDALGKITRNRGFISAREACRALVAAYIVKAIITQEFTGIPSTIINWAKETNAVDMIKLKKDSQSAIEKIKKKSELREMWNVSPDFDNWINLIEELQQNWPLGE
jgi:hypothetical protein